MSTNLEVLLTPAEFSALLQRDLSSSVCVVFDILRATSTMMTALANGADEILPVDEIDDAVAIRHSRPGVLLAGERNGLQIRADQSGGVDFDFGNSPREFTPQKIKGKTLVMTTTNGTRALRACAHAQKVLIGSFLGLEAIGQWIEQTLPASLLIVCSGTVDQAAYEDTLAAGALCERIWPIYSAGKISDSSLLAKQIYELSRSNLIAAAACGRNGRRLLAIPELREDVPWCFQRDKFRFLAELTKDATVRKLIPSDQSLHPQPN